MILCCCVVKWVVWPVFHHVLNVAILGTVDIHFLTLFFKYNHHYFLETYCLLDSEVAFKAFTIECLHLPVDFSNDEESQSKVTILDYQY